MHQLIEQDGRILVPVEGIVINNNDPEKRCRITVRVPGLFEPESGWVKPTATIGGGSPNRGGMLIPAIGSDVTLIFIGGDPEKPKYMCDGWNQGELPVDNIDGNPDIFAFSLGGFRLVFSAGEKTDEFPNGRGYMKLYSVPGEGETYIELDGNKNSAVISGITDVFVSSTGRVKINGNCAVEVQDRAVLPHKKPI